ncbi:hypothetical protein I553_4891 [Mycobacterium xenopi 4042]|uniref:Aldehyde dehydrogenase family protein n=1 Tax=Mycobacterium xenopi 4042 TaxID=1299334 RepID=X8AGE7_MYCXE|nr:hypothetical protein I553_4891 [Mycobacterium xenopi 4042]
MYENDITARINVYDHVAGCLRWGRWVTGGEGQVAVRSPTSGEQLGTVGVAGAAEVDAAVTAAVGR